MKNIEIDEALYQYIVSNTQYIGESASSILRRLVGFNTVEDNNEQNSTTDLLAASDEVNSQSSSNEPSLEEKTEDIIALNLIEPSIDNVLNYINKEELATQRGAVGRFLLILAALYRVHSEQFSVVTEIRGRDRLYFAASEQALSASGSSTKPFQIPDSPYWVITNSNTTRKKMMLTKATNALGYSDEDAEKIRDLL
jgi:negative modulator of initiation of replication